MLRTQFGTVQRAHQCPFRQDYSKTPFEAFTPPYQRMAGSALRARASAERIESRAASTQRPRDFHQSSVRAAAAASTKAAASRPAAVAFGDARQPAAARRTREVPPAPLGAADTVLGCVFVSFRWYSRVTAHTIL